MRKRTLVIGGVAALLLIAAVAAPVVLTPGPVAAARALPGPLAADEQAALIEACGRTSASARSSPSRR